MLARKECITFGTTEATITSSTSCGEYPLIRRELGDHQPVLVRGVIRLRGDPVRAHDPLPLKETEHDIRVADIHCQVTCLHHTGPDMGRIYNGARWTTRTGGQPQQTNHSITIRNA